MLCYRLPRGGCDPRNIAMTDHTIHFSKGRTMLARSNTADERDDERVLDCENIRVLCPDEPSCQQQFSAVAKIASCEKWASSFS